MKIRQHAQKMKRKKARHANRMLFLFRWIKSLDEAGK